MNTAIETYALGLLTEEMSESGQCIGKALRFGIDTPGVKDPLSGEVKPDTPRQFLAKELGDVLAAIEYACGKQVVDVNAVCSARDAKLAKLFDPNARDNLGRRLAP